MSRKNSRGSSNNSAGERRPKVPRKESSSNNSTVQCEFFFFDCDEPAVPSLTALLKQWPLCDAANVSPAKLSETIGNQANVGTVVSAREDCSEEVVAAATILNIQQHPNAAKVVGWLTARVADLSPPLADALRDAKNVIGWLISLRWTNTPIELVPQLFAALDDDVQWSQTCPEMPPREAPFYQFTHLFGTARVCINTAAKRVIDAPTSTVPADAVIHLHFEDSVFRNKATHQVCFPVDRQVLLQCDDGAPATHHDEWLLVYLISYEAWREAVRSLPHWIVTDLKQPL